jgi:hypothetical protein
MNLQKVGSSNIHRGFLFPSMEMKGLIRTNYEWFFHVLLIDSVHSMQGKSNVRVA